MPYFKIDDIPIKSNFPGVSHRFVINRETGATGVQMAEVTLNPGYSLPLHYHDVDDAMFVVSGKGIFVESEKEVEIEANMFLLAPAKTHHTLKNNGVEPLRIIFVWPTIQEVNRHLV